MDIIITKSLHDVLEQNPGKKTVHFTGDGHYHFRTFSEHDKNNKNLYTRLREVPEKSKAGIATGRHIQVPILNIKGKDDERYLVVKSLTREQVLAIKPVGDETLALGGPSKAEILAALEISPEELAAFLAAKKKK